MLHKLTRAYLSAGSLGLSGRLRPEQRKSLAGTRRQSRAPSRNCRRWGGKKQRRNMFHRRQMIPTTIAGNASAAQRSDTATNERCLCHITTYSLDHARTLTNKVFRLGQAAQKHERSSSRQRENLEVMASQQRRGDDKKQTTTKTTTRVADNETPFLSLGAMRHCKVEKKAFRRQWRRTIRYKASILSFPATPPSPQLRVLRASTTSDCTEYSPSTNLSIRLVSAWRTCLSGSCFIRLVSM